MQDYGGPGNGQNYMQQADPRYRPGGYQQMHYSGGQQSASNYGRGNGHQKQASSNGRYGGGGNPNDAGRNDYGRGVSNGQQQMDGNRDRNRFMRQRRY